MKLSKNELIAALSVSAALASSGLINTIIGKGHGLLEIAAAALVAAPVVIIASLIDAKFKAATRRQLLSGAKLAVVVQIVLTAVFVSDFFTRSPRLPLMNIFALTVLLVLATLMAWAWATLWTVVFHEVFFPNKTKN